MPDISPQEIQSLRNIFKSLIGIKIDWLSIPDQALKGFEPSQVAVIVNTLLDGVLPQIQLISNYQNQEKNELPRRKRTGYQNQNRLNCRFWCSCRYSLSCSFTYLAIIPSSPCFPTVLA